jgi:hypothetical protein
VVAVLTRWRNASIVTYKGEELDAKARWEPIVTREELLAVRKILASSKERARVGAPTSLAGGIARCCCGAKLVTHYRSARGEPSYRTYRCLTKRTGPDPTGARHVSIRADALDPLVRDAVLDTYFTRPASNGAAAAEAAQVSALYDRKAKARRGIDALRAAVREGTFTATEIAQDVAELRAEIESLEEALARTASTSAHAAMLDESMAAIFVRAAGAPTFTPAGDGKQHFNAAASYIASEERRGATRAEAINSMTAMYWRDNRDAPAVRAELAARFDAMPLEQRRMLARSLLSVTVGPGRGLDRVRIAPL